MEQKLTREDCLALLCNKRDALALAGETRYPKRSDFSDAEIVAIKAHLGPWPRALEAADIKAPREDAADRKQKTLERRIRAKRRQRAARASERKSSPEASPSSDG